MEIILKAAFISWPIRIHEYSGSTFIVDLSKVDTNEFWSEIKYSATIVPSHRDPMPNHSLLHLVSIYLHWDICVQSSMCQ